MQSYPAGSAPSTKPSSCSLFCRPARRSPPPWCCWKSPVVVTGTRGNASSPRKSRREG